MVGFIGDDNVQRLSSTATTPSAVISLVADAPKSIKTMTIYSKYFAVAFDSIPWLILHIILTGRNTIFGRCKQHTIVLTVYLLGNEVD